MRDNKNKTFFRPGAAKGRDLLKKRAAAFARSGFHQARQAGKSGFLEIQPPKGYDPELLYVECGQCGAPVLWEKGQATALLKAIGVDPLELTPYCLLLTDNCPQCSAKPQIRARLFHVGAPLFPGCGHA